MSDDNDRKTITFYATTVPLSDNYTVSLTKDLGPTSFTDGIAEQDDEDAEQPHRYTKQRILGKGGNGVVIAAIDRKMQRPVALKISTTEEGRAEQLRFLREARVTGQLNHPNVMPVYDIGTDTDGHLFFTMKVVSGKSLSERLSEQSAGSLLQRLLVFRQVCNAIAFAHSRGVLHRDIKPANVMMGEFGEVLVVDWGICKVMDESVEDYQSLTSTVSSDGLQTRVGEIAGTPAYMAPEQARGEVESLDNRTDIYALGALLYTILTSKAPIEGPIEQVLERVIRGDIRSPREVAPDQVPRELDTIIRKAMHPDQESRYQTVSSLSDDVQAFIEKRPVSAVQYSALQRLGKWASRNQHILRPVGFTAALSLAALVSGGLVHFNQMAESRDSALIEAQRANDAEREARIEAINGRASLSTSEAMYGHPGAAIDQLRAIRQQMLNLNTDTLRADIGFAIAKRTAIQPTIITTGEDPVEIGMSNNGSHVALLNKKALQIFQNSDIERSVHSNLPTGSALTFGPWNNHAPWLIQASPDGVRAVHPITKEERNWTGTFDNCSEPRNTFDNGWIAQSCAGQGIVVWDWNHSTPPRTYPLSDAETHVIQIS
ncbi:MAG: serine/threonine protein kinase, partial [Myxococcota bacterium]